MLPDNIEFCFSLTGFYPSQISQITQHCPDSVSTKDVLLLLIWMRQAPSEEFLAWLFDISQSSVNKIKWKTVEGIHHVSMTLCSALYEWAEQKIQNALPTDCERLANAVPFYGNQITAITDVTEQEIVMHIDKFTAMDTRSEKAQTHTVAKAVLVSPTGKIFAIGKSRRPKHDLTNTLMQDFLQQLLKFTKQEAIGGDSAYLGLESWLQCQVVTPFKAFGGRKTNEEKIFNNEFKSVRTVVENYFAHIKNFKILRYPWRTKGNLDQLLEKHHKVWVLCAALMDEYLFPHGIKEPPFVE